jgi:hypothetical protein
LRDFLSHQKYAVVALELLAERLIESVAICENGHRQLVVFT